MSGVLDSIPANCSAPKGTGLTIVAGAPHRIPAAAALAETGIIVSTDTGAGMYTSLIGNSAEERSGKEWTAVNGSTWRSRAEGWTDTTLEWPDEMDRVLECLKLHAFHGRREEC